MYKRYCDGLVALLPKVLLIVPEISQQGKRRERKSHVLMLKCVSFEKGCCGNVIPKGRELIVNREWGLPIGGRHFYYTMGGVHGCE